MKLGTKVIAINRLNSHSINIPRPQRIGVDNSTSRNLSRSRLTARKSTGYHGLRNPFESFNAATARLDGRIVPQNFTSHSSASSEVYIENDIADEPRRNRRARNNSTGKK
jgi:hypothetical protein